MILVHLIFFILLVHEVLLEQKDFIKSVKETHTDSNHGTNEDGEENEEIADDDADLDEYDREQQIEHVYYDQDTNSFVEEIGDENSAFYQKKVIKNGPGFQSVTIVSRGGAGPSGFPDPGAIFDSIINDLMGGGGGGQ